MRLQNILLILCSAAFGIFTSCKTGGNSENPYQRGKGLFIEYDCGACHSKQSSDEILFERYITSIRELDRLSRIESLNVILKNSDHESKGVYSSKLSDQDLQDLLEFISTVREKVVVD